MVKACVPWMLLLASTSLAAGCPSSGDLCARNSDCQVGKYCSGGSCISDCTAATVADDCASGESCNTFGMCVAPPDAGTRDAGPPRPDGGADSPDLRPACVIAGGTDGDADGYCDAGPDADCNDAAAAVNPGADEVCTPSTAAIPDRAIDEDCDGGIDESCAWYFGTPHPVMVREAGAGAWGFESPRLRGGGLRLYVRGATTGVAEPRGALITTRASLDAEFGAPARVAGLDSVASYVSSIGLSSDELEAYLQVPMPDGTMDIFRATRDLPTAAFGPATPVDALNGATNDYHPFLRADGLELLFVSARGGTPRLFRATRSDVSAPTWSTPEELTLGGDPSPLGDASPALSADGRTLFFARDLGPGRTLFVARRTSTSVAAFDTPVELVGINVAGMRTLFPEVSESTAEIYFVSNRPWSIGVGDGIWRARICRDGPCPSEPIPCSSTLRSPDGLHCYTSSVTDNHGTARSACVSLGGHLVEIQSAGEQDFIWAQFGGMTNLWLGLEETATTDVFASATGTPLVYTNWGPGEPNPGPGEACAQLHAFAGLAGRWVDIACTATANSVCETEMWPTW